MSFSNRLKGHHAHNFRTLRAQPLSELSGALGDLGTLLPLMIALTLTHSISLPSTLVFTGLANICTGIFFGIPLPVQPMKAIAAVAIARNFTIKETSAAGITVSAIVLVLSVSGLLEWFSRVIPIPVVKGIQVGAGLSLVLSAGTSLLAPLGWVGPSWADNYLWALFAFCFLLFASTASGVRWKVPYALIIFALGLLLAVIRIHVERHEHFEAPRWNIWHPHTYIPQAKTFLYTLSASLGQLPLTTLNSIIAVSHLSSELLPERPEPSPTALGISVASMNLVGCWFGAMPACHGSGGLAGQYRFGARSGASVIILGLFKLLLGLFTGDALVNVLQLFPKSLLGIMVIAAGVELAKVGESLNVGARDLWEESAEQEGRKPKHLTEEERRERWSVMMVTVAGLLAFRNDAVGFLAGMLWHWGLRAPEYWSRGQEGRSWFGFRARSGHEYNVLLDDGA
jgi:MFS superfamily sulfate permease-like transporter